MLLCTPTGGTVPRPTGLSSGAGSGVTYVVVESWVQRVSSQLKLPEGKPRIAPDPLNNEWKMLAVGLPVWFTTADATGSLDGSRVQDGIALTLKASRVSTSFDLGDGTVLRCTSMSVRQRGIDPMRKSPDCGHVYQRKGTYTITATSLWRVEWAALGESGVLMVPRQASTTLKVGELHSVITGH